MEGERGEEERRRREEVWLPAIYMTLAMGPLVGYLGFKIYCDGHDRLPAAVN